MIRSGGSVVILLVLAGCAGNIDQDHPAKTDPTVRDRFALTEHVSLNRSGNATVAIPLVTSEATTLSGWWTVGGLTPRYFEISYVPAESIAQVDGGPGEVLYLEHLQIPPHFSTSKRVNSQMQTYEEQCVDGRVRSSLQDAACEMKSRTSGYAEPWNFNGYAPIPSGKGYLLISQWRGNYSFELDFAPAALVGSVIEVGNESVAFAAESFEAPYMDIKQCHGDLTCGVIHEGVLPLQVRPGTWTYISAVLSSTLESYGEFCVGVDGAEKSYCATRGLQLIRAGWVVEIILGPGVREAELEVTIITSPTAAPVGGYQGALVSNFFLWGRVASLTFPEAFPTLEGPGTI